MTMPTRTQFYSERTYAVASSTIPERLRKAKTEATRWSIRQVIGELLREPGQCSHVDDPKPPVAVYGFGPERLHEYADALKVLAARQQETYTRRGKEHTRAMKRTTPTLLSAVASYPEPGDGDTDARRRWVQLVIGAAQQRWGKKLRSIIAHEDESHYHLHILIDNVGRPVKSLHMGHAAAAVEPDQAKRGEAYRAGCASALDWYWKHVGEPMGWSRTSPAPRPRLGRAKAAALRQQQLEEQADALAEADAEVARAAAQVAEQLQTLEARRRQLDARERRAAEREVLAAQELAALREVHGLLLDEAQAQRRVRELLGNRPAPAGLRAWLGL